MKKLLTAIFAGGLLASSVQAVTVNVVLDNGTVNNTTALAGFVTSGDGMSGSGGRMSGSRKSMSGSEERMSGSLFRRLTCFGIG